MSSLLLQEQDLTAEGRQDERAFEITSTSDSWRSHDESRGRREMQVTWLGEYFRGNVCHTNTGTDRGIGRSWSG